MGRQLFSSLAVGVAALALVPGTAGSAKTPIVERPCFGAASRDPARHCRDPQLRTAVVPRPSLALITPNFPCTPIQRDGGRSILHGAMDVCASGMPAAQATRTVALVGDSHAMTWRAPLEVAAQSLGWRALAITRSHCAYSMAVRRLPEPDRSGCVLWKRRIIRWFRGHPHIDVALMAQYTSEIPVVPASGASQFETEVAGYTAAWRALPATVKHVVVLRDNPRTAFGTFRCIHRVMARDGRPGETCAHPRDQVLLPDPAVTAARRMRSRRVQVVDLSRYMCSARLCFPVVGGALVNKDQTHLSRAFATSLGPYLLRRVRRLARRW